MNYPFLNLPRPSLESLLKTIESGRLVFPVSPAALSGAIAKSQVRAIAEELNALWEGGMNAPSLAYLLRSILAERSSQQAQRDRLSLVWTGDEVLGASTRDTKVVVRELFDMARKSVLISSYAVDRGENAEALFGNLAAKMDADSQLKVRMFLNIKRDFHDTLPVPVLVRNYFECFQGEIWPGNRLPEIFYDPRSLDIGGSKRSCLHAKCAIVDEECLLVTSANFTEAAHERNIEVGVMLQDKASARALTAQFDSLIARRVLLPLE